MLLALPIIKRFICEWKPVGEGCLFKEKKIVESFYDRIEWNVFRIQGYLGLFQEVINKTVDNVLKCETVITIVNFVRVFFFFV